MREFTEKDIDRGYRGEQFPRIYCDRSELIQAPLWYHNRGLSQTASGYGARLNSGLKIRYCGRDYRIYITCYSNAGTAWFKAKGQKIVVD